MIESVIQRLKVHEGFRSEIYKDHLGNPTIGYGFLVAVLDDADEYEGQVKRDGWITEETGEIILRNKVIRLANLIRRHMEWYDQMPEGVQDVIVEMCYQMGLHGFLSFRCTINAMKKRRFAEAKKFMLNSKWSMQTPARANELADIVGQYGNQV
jgi:lysozyme